MRILLITPTLPVPISGGRTRLFNLIRHLAGRHEFSVLSFIQPSEPPLLSDLEPYCQQIELVRWEGFQPLGHWRNRLQGWGRLLFSRRPSYAQTFPLDRMRPVLRQLVQAQAFEVVAFEQLFLVELLDEIEAKGLPTLLVEQNVESDIARKTYARAGNPVHKVRDWLTWRKLLAFEQHWVRRFPLCVAVSERDAALLRGMAPATQVHIVPNGVDSQSFAPPGNQRDPKTLLFFGTLSYGPNVDGLVWFCRQVLPAIRELRPDVRLDVVGLDPPPRVTALEQLRGVRVLGFVPDIRVKLWSATASVVPLHVGGGTRLKILEALAAGCPVISTTVGAEELDLVDGEHLLIADDPAKFARGILDLLGSDDQRHRLAESGRQFVVRRYDWQQIALSFESACRQASGQWAGEGEL